ncbi:MAG: hypothetical protein AAB495_04625 [Patescibacteria group bacterium]
MRKAPLIALAIFSLFCLIALWAWYAYKYGGEEVRACTEEAMECSDGSYVGRTGPKCEFAPCPGARS